MATYRLITKSTNVVTLVNKLFAPVRCVAAAAPSIRRSFRTTSVHLSDSDDFSRSVHEDYLRVHSSQGMEPSTGGGELRWYGKAHEESIILNFELPCLDKNNVKVLMEENTLIIKAKSMMESKAWRQYSNKFVLPEHLFNLKEINAEMNNRVLTVVLPKMITADRNYDHSREGGSGALGWEAIATDEEAIILRFDLQGLNKDDVEVSVEENILIIKAGSVKESDEEEEKPPRHARLVLPADLFKLNEIKAVMKDGVLKVVVPMVVTEERKDGWEVEVKGV